MLLKTFFLKAIFCLFLMIPSFLFSQSEKEKKIIRNLETLERYVHTIPNAYDQGAALRLIKQSKALLQENGNIEQSHPIQTANQIDEASFENLLKKIRSGFDEDRLNNLKIYLGNQKISCLQLKKIVQVFSFSSGKVSVIKWAYPSVIDPSNIDLVLQEVPFEKSDLKQFFYEYNQR